MSAAVQLLSQLRAQGFVFVLAADRVKVSPASSLPPDVLATLKAHRDELAQILREEAEGARPVEALIQIIPAERFVAELLAEGKLPAADTERPDVQQRWHLPGPAANPPIRKATTPPLASLAGIPLEGMTPPEHWEAIGGEAVVEALSPSAERSLRMAVIMAARGDPRTRAAGERDYHRLWRKFTTGDMA